MRTFFSLLALLLLNACSTQADAGRLVDMQIISREQGQVYASYYQAGRRYIAGNPGERYAVRLNNRSGQRVLAVLSVDGVNVISGETAGTQQAGYVLDPYSSIEVAGWRKSDQDIAQFYFTALPDSYAARTGRPENVGVIGLAVFREKFTPPVVSHYDTYDQPEYEPRRKHEAVRSPEAAPAQRSALSESLATAPEPRQKLGTGHGTREYAPVTHTTFERRSTAPDQLQSLFYDSRHNLVARGIIPRVAPYAQPQPFPQQYVPDPS